VRAAAEWPANPDAHVLMAAAEALDGHADRSRLAMKEAERLLPGDTVEKWLRRHPLPAADSYAEPRRRLAEALYAAGMPAQ